MPQAGAGGATGGVVDAAGEGGSVAAAGDGGASGGSAGEAGARGTLECTEDCSLLGEACVIGVCDGELGRCARWPVVACLSGDGCCPTGCAEDDDGDCTSVKVVLAPAFSGNRSQDGALGTTTFAGIMEEQRFHAFFGFDLSGVEGVIESAELDLDYEAYFSTDPAEHFVVRTVAPPVQALSDAAVRTDAFDALEAGAYCFDTTMTPEHVGSVVTFGLDATALAYLNANARSSVAFGIVEDETLGGSSSAEGIRFRDGASSPRERLTLSVEP